MMRPPAPTGVTHAENSQHAIHAGASRVTRNQRIVVIAQGLRLLLFVLATVLLGRWLEPAAFGFVGLISGLFLAAQEILDMGTTAVTTRQVAQQPSDERDLLNALMTWRCLLSLVLAAGVTLWGCWGPVQQAEQRWVLFSAAVVLLFMPWSSYHVVFQTRQAFGRASTLALATQSTFLISGIALLKTPFLAWATAISAGGAMGLAVITREWLQLWGSRWQATQLLGYRLRASWSSPGLRPLLRKAWLFGLAGVSYKLSALTGVFSLDLAGTPRAGHLQCRSAAVRATDRHSLDVYHPTDCGDVLDGSTPPRHIPVTTKRADQVAHCLVLQHGRRRSFRRALDLGLSLW